MPAGATDWVEVWRGLHGSRDFAAVVSAGGQLCDALEQARRAWVDRTTEIAGERRELTARVDALSEQLDQADDDERTVGGTVRAWHEIAHPDPWMVCPHMVCRHVVLTHPDVRAAARADVLIVTTGGN